MDLNVRPALQPTQAVLPNEPCYTRAGISFELRSSKSSNRKSDAHYGG